LHTDVAGPEPVAVDEGLGRLLRCVTVSRHHCDVRVLGEVRVFSDGGGGGGGGGGGVGGCGWVRVWVWVGMWEVQGIKPC